MHVSCFRAAVPCEWVGKVKGCGRTTRKGEKNGRYFNETAA